MTRSPLAWFGAACLFAIGLGSSESVSLQIAGMRGPSAPHRSSAPVFAPSTDCIACHNRLVSSTGEDVSIGASWRGSIMANAARDPYFHASVRRETIDHPTRGAEIEDECAACHLPAPRRIAHAMGRLGRVFDEVQARRPRGHAGGMLETDGVTCTVCHQIASDRLGTRESFNGEFALAAPRSDGARLLFGPFAPDAGRSRVMHSVTGFVQTEAPHIRESELCATCHTLITEARSSDGRLLGTLPEQMNYQEWRHSAFDDEKRSCQSCHMPPVAGPVRVSSVVGLERERLARHTFLGGNAFMLRLIDRYRADLGVEATSAELQAVATATLRQLEQDTASIAVSRADIVDGALTVEVHVTNKTGHKFSTGYPSRRAWLHVTVRDGQRRVLFESGRLNSNGVIDGNDSDADGDRYEPHHEEITGNDQVQVFESILGGADGRPTTGLLQAVRYLKDNRLLPRGFEKRTAPGEIAVVGQASNDPDFTGDGDRVRYRVAISGTAPVSVDVQLLYQPISARWAMNLTPYSSTPEPRRFVGYFNEMSATSATVVASFNRLVSR